jgi:hypothetical protein
VSTTAGLGFQANLAQQVGEFAHRVDCVIVAERVSRGIANTIRQSTH